VQDGLLALQIGSLPVGEEPGVVVDDEAVLGREVVQIVLALVVVVLGDPLPI